MNHKNTGGPFQINIKYLNLFLVKDVHVVLRAMAYDERTVGHYENVAVVTRVFQYYIIHQAAFTRFDF